MIGGYLYIAADLDVLANLGRILNPSFQKIMVWDKGFLFFDNPFGERSTSYCLRESSILLSQDLLVAEGSDGEYRDIHLEKDIAEPFEKRGKEVLDTISSDFRMVTVRKNGNVRNLFLFSNRAGSGRIYFSILKRGIVFCSDLRMLLRIVRLKVSQIGIYSILKYGAIPEPLTISEHVSAVPCAHLLDYNIDTQEYSLSPYFKFRFSDRDDPIPEDKELQVLEPSKIALQRSAGFLSELNPTMLLSGGIDSSLYGCYLAQNNQKRLTSFYCAFGDDDPELPFARQIAERINADLELRTMGKHDALRVLEDVVELTDRPFSDFSSLPIVFILKHIKESLNEQVLVIECNGGDDCFGFPNLESKPKYSLKHRVPRSLKRAISLLLKNYPSWKWESHMGILARLSALADGHEMTNLNYFLVLAPENYLDLNVPREWDGKLYKIMERVFSGLEDQNDHLSFKAKTTIRQLVHVNSRRWTAKALSVGESLGIRVVYPLIWKEVLIRQGELPWGAKVHKGIFKWPLKRLLQEFMPESFIYRKKSGFVPPFVGWLTDKEFNHKIRDILISKNGYVNQMIPIKILEELLSDALAGRMLRSPVLNFLWGAIFTEAWIQRYRKSL